MKLIMSGLSGGLILLLVIIAVGPAAAATVTGSYAGTGTAKTVDTGLTVLKSLRIVELCSRGTCPVAYTTDLIQAIGRGTFLNGNKRDTGITFDGGAFTVSHPDFTEPVTPYFWEAHGE